MALSKFVYASPSPIHGTGLYAKERLEKALYIGTYMGPTAKRDGTYVLWVYEEDGSAVGRSGRNLLRYLNHSPTPSAEFDGFDLYTVRTILPDEEITINYQPGEEVEW